MEGAEGDALHLLDFVSVGHRIEEGRRRSRADVASQSNDHLGLEHAMQGKEAAAEEQVRVRTVRDSCATSREEIELLRREPDAVREDGLVIEQSVAVIHIRVFGFRKELLYPAYLGLVLGDVRVHPHAGE